MVAVSCVVVYAFYLQWSPTYNIYFWSGYSIASQLIWFALYTWNHGCMYILASALHVPVNQPNQIQVYLVLGVSELEV